MFFDVDAKFFCWNFKKDQQYPFWLIQTKFPLAHISTKNFVGPTKFLLIQQNIFLGARYFGSVNINPV